MEESGRQVRWLADLLQTPVSCGRPRSGRSDRRRKQERVPVIIWCRSRMTTTASRASAAPDSDRARGPGAAQGPSRRLPVFPPGHRPRFLRQAGALVLLDPHPARLRLLHDFRWSGHRRVRRMEPTRPRHSPGADRCTPPPAHMATLSHGPHQRPHPDTSAHRAVSQHAVSTVWPPWAAGVGGLRPASPNAWVCAPRACTVSRPAIACPARGTRAGPPGGAPLHRGGHQYLGRCVGPRPPLHRRGTGAGGVYQHTAVSG